MKHTYKYFTLSFLFTISFYTAISQDVSRENYLSKIKAHNLSVLWKADSIRNEGEGEKYPFPEPIGFIGDNFERFWIHFTSIKKSNNPYVYYASGKTMVKGNIAKFKGTFTVKNVYVSVSNSEDEFPQYRQGSVMALVDFFEDSLLNYTGHIKGTITSDFYIDKLDSLHYNALFLAADGFANNQCKATWENYRTKQRRKCNWGDFRIPDSRGLDIGAGEFMVNSKYFKNGWKNYMTAWSNPPENSNSIKARHFETTWWK